MKSAQMKLKVFVFTVIGIISVLLLSQEVAISSSDKKIDQSRCIASPEVISDLKQQREELDKKEADLKKREEEFIKKEKSLQDELNKLEEVKKEFLGIKQQFDQKKEEQLAKFVETLERMSPKATAKVLGKVDERLAVQVMTRISTEKLAKVMNVMPTEKSSRLSELLTIGNASARAPAGKAKE